VLARDEGEAPQSTGGPAGSTDATTTTEGTVPAAAPAPPPWGDFAGAPPDLEAPPGGSATVDLEDGAGTLTIRRRDGSLLARAEFDDDGRYLDARYYDRADRLTVVVAAIREAAGGGAASPGAGARVRCGSGARASAGFRWTRFPIRWRVVLRPLAPGLGRSSALAAMRRARAAWNANRSHCRSIADRSRARFAFDGAARQRTGRNRVSVVEFSEVDGLGGVCRGTVACTLTWVEGARATESDTRIDVNHPSGLFAGARRASRIDLQSVMVHESGHTLGFDHVLSRDVVMFPSITRGTTAGRRLGRGDALGNNQRY
jgi:hypothetical protein